MTEEELKALGGQVGQILEFIDKLKEVKVDGVEPTSHPLALKNVFREDVGAVREPPPQQIEAFLKSAPSVKGRFFEVPKVIEDNP